MGIEFRQKNKKNIKAALRKLFLLLVELLFYFLFLCSSV